MQHDDNEMMTVENPGSPVWSAAGAFFGQGIGTALGLLTFGTIATARAASKIEDDPYASDLAAEPAKFGAIAVLGMMLGGAGGAAGGAALGAPAGLRGKAAMWGAIGGAIPFFGFITGPLAAYLATRPGGGGRKANMTTTTTALLAVLGLAAAGGATYAGVKIWKDRKAKEEIKNRDPKVLVYLVDEVDGLTIDVGPGDAVQIDTPEETWAWNSELPATATAGGWVAEASKEYAGTWDVEMVADKYYANFKIKIHDV